MRATLLLVLGLTLLPRPARADCADLDRDGHQDATCGGDDCNDHNPGVHPGAAERCDGADDDCDGKLGATEVDGDGDRVRLCDFDCDDDDASISPRAVDVCEDGIDQDCSGADRACDCADADFDRVPPLTCGGADCDDGSQIVRPGAGDACGDGIDQNCSGGDASCTSCDGEVRDCYTGPRGTLDEGRCRAGTQECVLADWGRCLGEVLPVEERCDTPEDDDCDGAANEGCGGAGGGGSGGGGVGGGGAGGGGSGGDGSGGGGVGGGGAGGGGSGGGGVGGGGGGSGGGGAGPGGNGGGGEPSSGDAGGGPAGRREDARTGGCGCSGAEAPSALATLLARRRRRPRERC